MKHLKKFESIKIIEGEKELKKPSKYGYVTVEIDGNTYYLSPEDVKVRIYREKLIEKGYDEKEIDELIDLVKNQCWREERDSLID